MSEIAEALDSLVAAHLRGLNTVLPGRVEKWDWRRARADVKPLLRETVNGRPVSRAVVPAVRVLFPEGDAASLSFPLKVGDFGLLLWSQRSLEEWLNGDGREVTPRDGRVMAAPDAFFLPGLRPFPKGTPAQDADSVVLRNGGARLRLQGDRVALGNASGEVLDLLTQVIDTLVTATVVDPVSGLLPLDPATIAALQAIKANLALVKGSL